MTSPVRIDPAAIYDDGALHLILDIPTATLIHARRAGRLRYTRQGRRALYLGQWILDWLAAAAATREGAAHA